MKFNDLLAKIVSEGSSDIHLHAGMPPMARKSGRMVPVSDMKLSPKVTAALVDIMCNEDQKRIFSERRQVDLAYAVEGIGRFRVNMFRQRGSVSAVLRVINSDESQLQVVNLPEDTINYFRDQEKGILLVTGPTGSGKSTTMCRIIDEVNQKYEKMIVTVEDPIEYLHRAKKSVIVQREIGPDALSFKDALIAAMRQDPDIILIGEIRDQETIAAAIEAAQTGHLVFGTLHTQDTVRTINRLLDLFPPEERDTARVLFAESCVGILSQMLLQRKGGGRVAAMEVLKVNLRVRDLIKDEKRTTEIYEVLKDSTADGMQSFDDHLAQLYEQDLIEYETGYMAATSAQSFKMAATQVHEKRKMAAANANS